MTNEERQRVNDLRVDLIIDRAYDNDELINEVDSELAERFELMFDRPMTEEDWADLHRPNSDYSKLYELVSKLGTATVLRLLADWQALLNDSAAPIPPPNVDYRPEF